MKDVRPGTLYHDSENRPCQIVTVAEHEDTKEKLVIYQLLCEGYGTYAKPYEAFVNEEKREERPEEKRAEPGGVNPILLEFLDADTLEEKMHIMAIYRNKMDENLLNSIAISLDVVVDKKGVQEKYDEIMNCLSMMEKFECSRFR